MDILQSVQVALDCGAALNVLANLLRVRIEGAINLLNEFAIALVDESHVLVLVEGATARELGVALLLGLHLVDHLLDLGGVILDHISVIEGL